MTATDIVLASGNAGKLREFDRLLAGTGLRLRAQAEFGIADVEETGLTFVENALLKARHAARSSGLPALADDSGLCVDALYGAPGLRSARYAESDGNAAANIGKLLQAMAEIPLQQRTARFVCVLALLRHAEDPQPLLAEGVWEGRIAMTPSGTEGFGYDPVFVVDADGGTAAQLAPDAKNRISHRARALQALKDRLRQTRLG